MITGLESTPPLIAWALGFFMALALKRGRIENLLNRLLPTENKDE